MYKINSSIIPVILIDFNSAQRTLKFICDFKKEISEVELRFIVVDNSCDSNNFEQLVTNATEIISDNSVFDIYSENNKEILYVNPHNNLGFAKANNLGFSIALKYFDFDYVLFSNNDIFVTGFKINSLLEIFRVEKTVAIVGPKVIGLDGKDQSPYKYCSIYDRWWKGKLLYPLNVISKKLDYIYRKSIDLDPTSECKQVYRIIGAFMLCKKDCFVEVEGFDENTFMYAEEMILSEKLKQKGYQTYYCPDTTIIHEGGYTTKNTYNELKKKKKQLESELFFYKKYKNTPQIIIFLTRIIFELYSLKYKICHLFYKKGNTGD